MNLGCIDDMTEARCNVYFDADEDTADDDGTGGAWFDGWLDDICTGRDGGSAWSHANRCLVGVRLDEEKSVKRPMPVRN